MLRVFFVLFFFSPLPQIKGQYLNYALFKNTLIYVIHSQEQILFSYSEIWYIVFEIQLVVADGGSIVRM